MTKISDLLSNPRFNGIGAIVGIIGVACGAYFFTQSIREREPSYYLDPARVQILTRDVSAPIKVFRDDGTEIAANLTAVRLYFWNAGKEAIRPTDVLRPIQVTLLDDQASVLQAKVIKESREVSEFKANTSSSKERTVDLSFAILDRDDGAAIQIIYEGDPEAELAVSGVIQGVRTMTEYAARSGKPREGRIVAVFGGVTLIGCVVGYFFLSRWDSFAAARGLQRRVLTIVAVTATVQLAMTMFALYMSTLPVPPTLLTD